MSDECSIVKVPEGVCEHCGEEYGIFILVGTGEIIDRYSDCKCYDDVLYKELADEESRDVSFN